ncbi:MAG TPA: RNA 2',3'-cyclic phosphodiesterase [Terriglobales bacterium]|jgi:2'-5' RNA ligase
MRLFVALDIDDAVRERITGFADEFRPFAPNARWVKAESLHVTLKFIGERPDSTAKEIERVLDSIRAPDLRISFRGAGFFPNPRSARVFWIGIEAGEDLQRLAQEVEAKLSELGIPKEDRPFSPHLTLARASGGSGAPGWRKGDRPNRQFARLQEVLSQHPAPDFGSIFAHEFFLYRSLLSSKGAQYTKIARFVLGSRD